MGCVSGYWASTQTTVTQDFSTAALQACGAEDPLPWGLSCAFRMNSSSPGCHCLDASSTALPVMTTEKVSRHCHEFPKGQKSP